MPRILVVDDKETVRRVLRNLLKKEGYEVIEAEDEKTKNIPVFVITTAAGGNTFSHLKNHYFFFQTMGETSSILSLRMSSIIVLLVDYLLRIANLFSPDILCL